MEQDLIPVVLDELAIDGVQPGSAPVLDGRGTLQFKSGCTYDGDLVEGRLHGRGKLTFPDGMTYEGDFDNNTISGQGVYTWPSGARYEGEVLGGKRHGQGRMSFRDSPVVYEGEWWQGVRHGQGQITLNVEGSHWYRGGWLADQKHGYGVMHYANGDVYEGGWEHDAKSGHGLMHWHSRGQQYEGQWARNKPNGVGLHIWFQQLVSEPSPTNHALLLMFNRYHGQFGDGKRSGYGVLHYATGARYEGFWQADKKQGQGAYVFENGEVWVGHFEEDRPVLAEGQSFVPRAPNVTIQVEDLANEEEVPAAAARGVANVLAVYNTDLRALYDKYCKRPSLHLLRNKPRPVFTLVTCQVWEMLGDTRLITAITPLARVDELLAQSRRPPTALEAFRTQARHGLRESYQAAGLEEDADSVAYWEQLAQEHVLSGLHAPTHPLLFREFCEFLVRLAAARYRSLPGLERRLHTLINAHLLHQVSKNKASLPPPPRTAFHAEMWAGNAMSALQDAEGLLRMGWSALIASTQQGKAPGSSAAGSVHKGAQGKEAGQGEQGQGQEQGARSLLPPLPPPPPEMGQEEVYVHVSTVRDAVRLLQRLGLLPSPDAAMQAAAALTFNYLTINTYGHDPSSAHKLRIEGDVPPPDAPTADGGADGTDGTAGATGGRPGSAGSVSGGALQQLSDADTREVLSWADQPLLYPDWVEGVARAANVLAGSMGVGAGAGGEGEVGTGGLQARLTAFLQGPGGLQEAMQKWMGQGEEVAALPAEGGEAPSPAPA